MAQYLSPGVYVEEVPSAVQPIAGAGTSTAAFVGVVPGSITVPVSSKIAQNVKIAKGDGTTTELVLSHYPLKLDAPFKIRVDGVEMVPTDDFTLANVDGDQESKVTFTAGNAPATGAIVSGDYVYEYVEETFTLLAAAGEVKLCTSFAEFRKFFGGFSTDAGQRKLAHAVYGFFNNGGTRCYVVRETSSAPIGTTTLEKLSAIDEIAIVAVPGIHDVWGDLAGSCQMAEDRFAILDCKETVETGGNLDLTKLDPTNASNELPDNSDYAAFYFPWIQVFDPATKTQDPFGDGLVYVPPSGHVAGIYARVDTERGVHKAPANEKVLKARGLKYRISKAQQDGLNPQGVNCIRDLNGNINVWGARTIGGDANGEWKYVNVRRLFNYLRESIDQGTQWVVFEPNTPDLWARITRNITAFLTNVWRAGALFGTTPQEAFYVKCDGETNPPEVRDLGQVVTEIGVAIVKPAEFVIFRISQWAGPGG